MSAYAPPLGGRARSRYAGLHPAANGDAGKAFVIGRRADLMQAARFDEARSAAERLAEERA